MKKIVMTLPALLFVFALPSASQAAVKANYNKSMPKSVCFVTTDGSLQQIILGSKKATKIEIPPAPWDAGAKSVKASLSQVQAFSNIDPDPDDVYYQGGMGSGTGTAVQYTGKDDVTGEKVNVTEYHAEWRSTYFSASTGPGGGDENWSEVFDLYWGYDGKIPLESGPSVWIKDEYTGETTGMFITEIICKTGQIKYPDAAPPRAEASRAPSSRFTK
jgi:hypothetical protein